MCILLCIHIILMQDHRNFQVSFQIKVGVFHPPSPISNLSVAHPAAAYSNVPSLHSTGLRGRASIGGGNSRHQRRGNTTVLHQHTVFPLIFINFAIQQSNFNQTFAFSPSYIQSALPCRTKLEFARTLLKSSSSSSSLLQGISLEQQCARFIIQ